MEDVLPVPVQQGANHHRAPDQEVAVVLRATTRVRPGHIDISAQPAEEIRSLGGPVLRSRLGELVHALEAPSREDEDRAADWVGELPVLEFAIRHRREEVGEPPQLLGLAGGEAGHVELVPQHQRQLAAERNVPHLVQGLDQLVGFVELGEFE